MNLQFQIDSFISKELLHDTSEFDVLDQRSCLLCYLINSALCVIIVTVVIIVVLLLLL